MSDSLLIGVVTVSDRAYRGEYEDRSGPAIGDYLRRVLAGSFDLECRLVDDDQTRIEQALLELADEKKCHWVLTTGGTGPAPRDVTPEATRVVGQRELPGFGEQMRRVSIQKVPTAILSRQMAVIRNQTFILNLPGSPRAISECLDAVMAAVPDCLEHLGAPRVELVPGQIEVFRPHD